MKELLIKKVKVVETVEKAAVYSFSELSSEVKARLIENERLQSLSKFYERIGVIEEHGYDLANTWSRLSFDDDKAQDLVGDKADKYICENFLQPYLPDFPPSMKLELRWSDPFTGAAFGYPLLEAYKDWKPQQGTNVFLAILADKMDELDEMSAEKKRDSDEFFANRLAAENTLYLEDGSIAVLA